MSTTTALGASLLFLCISAAAQQGSTPPFACNLKAISAPERPRYTELTQRVRAAIRDRAERANGYTFTLDGNAVSLTEAAEWISFERLCCPFLTMQLSASGGRTDWILALTGPQGVKPLLNVEFPPQRTE